ncbi:sensor histidine kinase [Candidatus Omnitrophota bacterium]
MKNQEKEIQELRQALLKANEDIKKLSNVKSDFVSIISHELRTPLTSIKESVSLVLEGVTGPINDEQKRFLNITKNNIDRLVKVIVDILDFSKLQSGKLTIQRKKVNINDVIKDVHNKVKDYAEERNLIFNLELSDRLKTIWLDPERVKQVIKNLVLNAIKFNKQKGKIVILSSEEEVDGREFIKVTVEDTGAGISEENLLKIFKEFNPLDSTMTRSYGGVGLGLAICKNIIKLHGGKIWAESKEDDGSKFIFILPAYKKDEKDLKNNKNSL